MTDADTFIKALEKYIARLEKVIANPDSSENAIEVAMSSLIRQKIKLSKMKAGK